jgi:hypothetical protein
MQTENIRIILNLYSMEPDGQDLGIEPMYPYLYRDFDKLPYGRYLVVRKDGKKHFETFNGTGWSYNHKSIVAYYLPKIS